MNIFGIWQRKKKLIDEFEIAMKQKAIDCKLFYNRNNYKGEIINVQSNNNIK